MNSKRHISTGSRNTESTQQKIRGTASLDGANGLPPPYQFDLPNQQTDSRTIVIPQPSKNYQTNHVIWLEPAYRRPLQNVPLSFILFLGGWCCPLLWLAGCFVPACSYADVPATERIWWKLNRIMTALCFVAGIVLFIVLVRPEWSQDALDNSSLTSDSGN